MVVAEQMADLMPYIAGQVLPIGACGCRIGRDLRAEDEGVVRPVPVAGIDLLRQAQVIAVAVEGRPATADVDGREAAGSLRLEGEDDVEAGIVGVQRGYHH